MAARKLNLAVRDLLKNRRNGQWKKEEGLNRSKKCSKGDDSQPQKGLQSTLNQMKSQQLVKLNELTEMCKFMVKINMSEATSGERGESRRGKTGEAQRERKRGETRRGQV